MKEIRKKKQYQDEIFKCSNIPLEWNIFAHKTILISGATGMIGVFLIDVLMERNKLYKDDIKIIAIGRDEEKAKNRLGIYWNVKEFQFIVHDVNKPFMTKEIKESIDFIVHGASNTHPILYSMDPIGTIEANVIGTKNLLDLGTVYKGCRFIFLSSVEIYGENRGDVEAFHEDDCGYLNCNTLRACYTEGKRLGEALCQAYISKYQSDAVILRLCRVYGPTMKKTDTKAHAQFLVNASTGNDIVLKSEGNQKYSYLYVADIITAILTIMIRGKKGEAYNVADEDSNITLKELASYIASISNVQVIYDLPDEIERKGYSIATKAILNANKLKETGWISRYNIQDGIRITYDIIKK